MGYVLVLTPKRPGELCTSEWRGIYIYIYTYIVYHLERKGKAHLVFMLIPGITLGVNVRTA